MIWFKTFACQNITVYRLPRMRCYIPLVHVIKTVPFFGASQKVQLLITQKSACHFTNLSLASPLHVDFISISLHQWLRLSSVPFNTYLPQNKFGLSNQIQGIKTISFDNSSYSELMAVKNSKTLKVIIKWTKLLYPLF